MSWAKNDVLLNQSHPLLAVQVENLLHLASHLKPLEQNSCCLENGIENLLLTIQFHEGAKYLEEVRNTLQRKADELRSASSSGQSRSVAQKLREVFQPKKDGSPESTTKRSEPSKQNASASESEKPNETESIKKTSASRRERQQLSQRKRR